MKTLNLMLAALSLAASVPVSASASGLEAKEVYLVGWDTTTLVYAPITEINVKFDGNVVVEENACGSIYMGESIIASGLLTVNGNLNAYGITGTVTATFEEELLLPKGETYRFVIAEGLISSEDDPSITNDEIVQEFEVPYSIGASFSDFDGTIVESAQRMWFYWKTEAAAGDGNTAILYREGVEMRTYPIYVTWDWGLGQAYVDFGEVLNFEKGVEFSLVIPAGSVASLYRSDIVNEEDAVATFTGGSEEAIPTIDYYWCSLYDNHPSDTLGEVYFYYDQPVVLSSNPEVQLWQGYVTEMVKSVVPTLSVEADTRIMCADFEQTPLESEVVYSIIIVEGSLITESGDMAINARKSDVIDSTNGISAVSSPSQSVTVDGRVITIKNDGINSIANLISIDGKLIDTSISTSNSAQFIAPAKGIYVLQVNGQAQKIYLK